jgi:hypothetical protein
MRKNDLLGPFERFCVIYKILIGVLVKVGYNLRQLDEIIDNKNGWIPEVEKIFKEYSVFNPHFKPASDKFRLRTPDNFDNKSTKPGTEYEIRFYPVVGKKIKISHCVKLFETKGAIPVGNTLNELLVSYSNYFPVDKTIISLSGNNLIVPSNKGNPISCLYRDPASFLVSFSTELLGDKNLDENYQLMCIFPTDDDCPKEIIY